LKAAVFARAADAPAGDASLVWVYRVRKSVTICRAEVSVYIEALENCIV
jgi:hypothetical protein